MCIPQSIPGCYRQQFQKHYAIDDIGYLIIAIQIDDVLSKRVVVCITPLTWLVISKHLPPHQYPVLHSKFQNLLRVIHQLSHCCFCVPERCMHHFEVLSTFFQFEVVFCEFLRNYLTMFRCCEFKVPKLYLSNLQHFIWYLIILNFDLPVLQQLRKCHNI